jgi:hypothetical protein
MKLTITESQLCDLINGKPRPKEWHKAKPAESVKQLPDGRFEIGLSPLDFAEFFGEQWGVEPDELREEKET